jgi:hypothetical protein
VDESTTAEKGIAAQMTHAFLKDAKARGLAYTGKCWMKNEPSI